MRKETPPFVALCLLACHASGAVDGVEDFAEANAYLDSLKAKVMVIVGGQDKRVPPIQGENLHNVLLRRGVDHRWVYDANEGHGFYLEQHRARLYKKIAEFLDRQIGTKTPIAAIS